MKRLFLSLLLTTSCFTPALASKNDSFQEEVSKNNENNNRKRKINEVTNYEETKKEEDFKKQKNEEDFLFPKAPLGEERIKKGVELIKKFDSKEYKESLEKEQEQLTVKFNQEYDFKKFEKSDFYVSGGGCKRVLELDAEGKQVIFVGPSKIHAQLERDAYKILTMFGLPTQQNVDLITVEFNNKTISNVISSSSFKLLTQDNERRTWDTKNRLGFGKISIFGSKENFESIDYNVTLLLPFVNDYALWALLGFPGDTTDSANLIFKQKGSQTLCRLFLYDIYQKGVGIDDNDFSLKKIRKEALEENDVYLIKRLEKSYLDLCEAAYEYENKALWPDHKDSTYFYMGDKESVKSMWKKIEPRLWEPFKKEYNRLCELFKSVTEN
jgi:hypothetical protein